MLQKLGISPNRRSTLNKAMRALIGEGAVAARGPRNRQAYTVTTVS
jgi:hypothetical protein